MEVSFSNYQSRQSNQGNASKERQKVIFLNTLLQKDGDVAVVRFPYAKMEDIKVNYTHLVKVPGSVYGKRIRCEGDGCPLCKEGIKQEARVFVTVLAYVPDEQGNIQVIPAVWDRPAPFADIEIRSKMEECTDNEVGPLCDNLVKIKRSGQGFNNTRYTLTVISNKTVYNPAIYKPDFALLENVDAARMLSKSYDQYVESLNKKDESTPADTSASRPQASASAIVPNPATVRVNDASMADIAMASAEPQPQPAADVPRTPAPAFSSNPIRTPSASQPVSQPASSPSFDSGIRRPIRHTF